RAARGLAGRLGPGARVQHDAGAGHALRRRQPGSARAHPVRVPRTAPRRQARSRPAVLIALLRAGEFGGVGVLEGAVALDRVGEFAVEAGALHALLGDDALLLEQVRVLRL